MYQFIKQMPKLELHCHLDGSVPLHTLKKLAIKEGIDPNIMDLIPVNHEVTSLNDYLQSFDYALSVLQSKNNLEEATYAIIKEVNKENVKYIELRFAPLLHLDQGAKVEDIVQGVVEGLQRGCKEFDVQVNLIIICMRHHDNEKNIELVKLINRLDIDKSFIRAYDFAGNEEDSANDNIQSIISEMRDDISLTIHSGECGCVHNVYQAVKLGAKRIGHGVAVKQAIENLELFKENNTHFEICPTSNIQTKAIEKIVDLPIKEFMEENISFSINTDNRTVSNTTLTDEFFKVQQVFNLSKNDLRKIILTAAEASFTDEIEQKQLLKKLRF